MAVVFLASHSQQRLSHHPDLIDKCSLEDGGTMSHPRMVAFTLLPLNYRIKDCSDRSEDGA